MLNVYTYPLGSVYQTRPLLWMKPICFPDRPSNEESTIHIYKTPALRQHKELRTRIGHQILRLQHLLPPSRGVEQLIALHIDCYEKLWGLEAAVTDMNSREPRPMVLESFTNLMSEIDGRMSTVVVRACAASGCWRQGRRIWCEWRWHVAHCPI